MGTRAHYFMVQLLRSRLRFSAACSGIIMMLDMTDHHFIDVFERSELGRCANRGWLAKYSLIATYTLSS